MDHHGLYAVPAGGGTPKLIVKPDPARWNHFDTPQFLPPPDSSQLLLTAQDRTRRHVSVLHSLSSGRQEVLNQSLRVAYSPTGHLVYPMESLLWAEPFTPGRTQGTTERFPVAQANYTGRVSVSLDGTLVFQGGRVNWQLRWRDRHGGALDAFEDPALSISGVALSPDGGKAAVSTCVRHQLNLWIWDFARRTRTRLSAEEGDASRSRLAAVGQDDRLFLQPPREL